MKQNLLKRWWSYINPIELEEIPSSYNESLSISLVKGRYQLCTPNAIYSYEDKYLNFKESFDQINIDNPRVEDVLILGFGLGSIPIILERIFKKRFYYTGIEIDEAVLQLASKYVLDDLKSPIQLLQCDAYYFLQTTSEKFDMICIDIFIDDKIPEVFLEKSFLQLIKKSLSKNGVVLFNHLAHNTKDKKHANEYFTNIFSIVFPSSIILEVHQNFVILNDRERLNK